VAVQSHYFSVGPIVPWAEPGVGAVATQAWADPSYGPLGLGLMRMGRSAPEALRALVSADSAESRRQVAMIDAQGRVAAHTGDRCIAEAGHRVGRGYAVQANLMEQSTVWGAMAHAYETAPGDLAERLLAALEAAEREGGDIRGRQSAAILVVSGTNTDKPWGDRVFDLRVEDHPDPVAELRRLVTLQRAYAKLNDADRWMNVEDLGKAIEALREATSIVRDEATNGEIAFWAGVTLVTAGRFDEAVTYFARAYRQDERWAEVVRRLHAAGELTGDEQLIDRIVAGMRARRP